MVLTGLVRRGRLLHMFERFTTRARHTVVLAQEEARRMHHNYIGTEHVLLGLLGEPEGLAARALSGFGFTLDGARAEVAAIVEPGKKEMSGHIPFTPRAKKTLELALREALQLHHNYIGTEHILLGVIREGDGVGARVLRQHADLLAIRVALLDQLKAGGIETTQSRRWLRRRSATGETGEAGGPAEDSTLSATPAADTTLGEAARLAGSRPVGSHHLLLAALSDSQSAAARALSGLGIDLDQARSALLDVDVAGTSDEPPEEAGRRQMTINVTGDRLTLEATDPVLVQAGQAALRAMTGSPDQSGVIPGDHPATESLTSVWQALQSSLGVIERHATLPAEAREQAAADQPAKPGDEAA
jgi:ATP-dependent Clp protease ATP-binding subunit ClpA